MAWIVTEGVDCDGTCLMLPTSVCTHPEVMGPYDDLTDFDLDWDSWEEYETASLLKPGESFVTNDGWRKVERTAE